MRLFVLAAFAAMMFTGLALAQTLQQGMPYLYPKTLQTTPAVVLPFNQARKQLTFVNPNDAVKVAVCPAVDRVTSIFVFCTLNGAGAIPLLPYAIYTISGVGGNPSLPQSWVAVGGAPNAFLTILEWE